MNDKAQGLSEDWLSVWLGLLIFLLALSAAAGTDLLGWAVSTSVWTNVSTALGPVTKSWAGSPGWTVQSALFAISRFP